jgi:hypothetical protein
MLLSHKGTLINYSLNLTINVTLTKIILCKNSTFDIILIENEIYNLIRIAELVEVGGANFEFYNSLNLSV